MSSRLPVAPDVRLNAKRSLSAQALREVQAVLRMWPTIKHELADYEADAVLGGYCTDFEARGKTSRVSNPTMSRALRLATDPKVRALRHLDQAIERALATVAGSGGKDAPIRKTMRDHYLRGHSWVQVAKTIGVTPRTMARWNDRFVITVAHQLGRRV